MVIENRDAVVAGTKLTATYKKQQYACTVDADKDGKLAFVYDGKSYNSPSSAGTAVIGTACNGWRFWSIEGAISAYAGSDERYNVEGFDKDGDPEEAQGQERRKSSTASPTCAVRPRASRGSTATPARPRSRAKQTARWRAREAAATTTPS